MTGITISLSVPDDCVPLSPETYPVTLTSSRSTSLRDVWSGHTCGGQSYIEVSHGMATDRVTETKTIPWMLQKMDCLAEPRLHALPYHSTYYDRWARTPHRPQEDVRRTPSSSALLRPLSQSSPQRSLSPELTSLSLPADVELPSSAAVVMSRRSFVAESTATCDSVDSIIDHYNKMFPSARDARGCRSGREREREAHRTVRVTVGKRKNTVITSSPTSGATKPQPYVIETQHRKLSSPQKVTTPPPNSAQLRFTIPKHELTIPIQTHTANIEYPLPDQDQGLNSENTSSPWKPKTKMASGKKRLPPAAAIFISDIQDKLRYLRTEKSFMNKFVVPHREQQIHRSESRSSLYGSRVGSASLTSSSLLQDSLTSLTSNNRRVEHPTFVRSDPTIGRNPSHLSGEVSSSSTSKEVVKFCIAPPSMVETALLSGSSHHNAKTPPIDPGVNLGTQIIGPEEEGEELDSDIYSAETSLSSCSQTSIPRVQFMDLAELETILSQVRKDAHAQNSTKGIAEVRGCGEDYMPLDLSV